MHEVIQELGYEINHRNMSKCPVHGGKDYNFHVNEMTGHCYSQCGQSWSVVQLVEDVKGLTFPEAIEFIARINSISLEYSGDKDRGNLIFEAKERRKKLEIIHDINRTAADHYIKNWSENNEINGRSFSKTILEQFEIGVSNSKSELNALTKRHAWESSLLIELGLIKVKEDRTYDFFRNRIMFPLHDHKGTIAGFAGRRIKDPGKSPKYINSQESISYKKSNILYGLYQSRRSIYKKEFAYIVEGYTDVIGLHDNDINNVVATGGTALTQGQAKLLSRYTKLAILLFDGDEAGQNAMIRNIDILLNVNISVKLCILPPGEDPESFIRKEGKDGFVSYTANEINDAIVWKVERELIGEDPFQIEKAINIAARLISYLPSEIQADKYISKLSKSIGTTKTNLKKEVKVIKDGHLKKDKNKLTPDQIHDITHYGIYTQKNNYFLSQNTSSGSGHAISNFIIKPIMLVLGSDRSRRLVEIINDRGQSFIKDIDSDDFVDLGRLKKQVERMGNFIFSGKEEQYVKVKSKIYSEMPAAHMITTLGQHKSGFWTWANGLTYNKEFHPVDEYGLVDYEATKYYLPAFSKIHLDVKSDDQFNTYEDDKLFSYFKRKKSMDLYLWMTSMKSLYGDNGIVGSIYFIASIFRDIIYHKFNFFPHLNLFGPSGSGKSYLAWSLVSLFGKAKQPFNLAQGTNVGFFRRLAQTRNAMVWFDEYSNEIDFKRIEALKAAYDGAGHEKGIKSQDNRTVTTQVNASVIISGQHQPIKDIALFKRCISINFSSGEFTTDQQKLGDELKEIEATGALSMITGHLHQHRSLIKDKFNQLFDQTRTAIQSMIPIKTRVEDRILNNYVIPLTVYKLFHNEMKLPFDIKYVESLFAQQIIDQSSAIFKEDELSVWWNLIQYLIESLELRHNNDIIVQNVNEVTLLKENKETHKLSFDSFRKILFLRLTKAHPLYLEYHKRQYNKQGMAKQSLLFYLKNSKAFIGVSKAKKFDGNSYRCFVFDLEKIGMEIPETNYNSIHE
ncbi:MAG: toprim domain-containing protein [Chlorobi bacterium]|nr:toprim domain-containing protein [Chlorobiota bacterium]